MHLLLSLALLTQAHAAPNARISCLGRAHGDTVYLEGNLQSATRIDRLALKIFGRHQTQFERDRLDGARDDFELPPRQETWFILSRGNPPTYLKLPDAELPAVNKLLKATDRQVRDAIFDRDYAFHLGFVSPSGEIPLNCGPKAIGEE